MCQVKKTTYYLERGFPENLEPAFTNRSTRRKRALVEKKKRILKRSIRKSLQTLVKPFFSAPTKKGILLEKSRDSFQDLFSRGEGEGLNPSILQKTKSAPFLRKEMACQVLGEGEKNPLPLRSRQRRYKFLFPLYRLKSELSKRESQYGKIELYKKQIQERKKLAFIYGAMSKNSIKKLVKRARSLSSIGNPSMQNIETTSMQGMETTLTKSRRPSTGEKTRTSSGRGLCSSRGLVLLLESRLDVALFRASFFSSVPMARQWISHNRVIVNKRKVCAPSYQLKAGDCIEILPLSTLPLKESQTRRIKKILPFRRSRQKLVTPSLIRDWCSFETLLAKPKDQLHPVDLKSEEIHKRGPFIERNKILAPFTTIKNFSLMRDHLLSVWGKSVSSQSSTSLQTGYANRRFANHQINPAPVEPHSLQAGNRDSLPQKNSFFLGTNQGIPPLFYKSDSFLAKKRNKRKGGKIPNQNRRKTRTSSTSIQNALRKGVTLFGRLQKRELDTLDFLNAKQALIQPRKRKQRLAGLQVSSLKPLHLEVSYRLLTAIFLYSPQKVAYPASLDFPLIMSLFK